MPNLAEMVRDELVSAGLPVVTTGEGHGGVHVDGTDGGDAWVGWRTGPELRSACQAALRRGAYRPGGEQHQSLDHQSAVITAMNQAITTVLTATGFEVREGADEFHRPLDLLVVSHMPVPHWRDPITAPLDGASGFAPGLRVRVRSGEFAGAELEVAATKHRLGSTEPLGYELRLPHGRGTIEVAVDDVEFAADPGR
jgi:hypothetical protein